VLITEYFQQIESQLAGCMYLLEIDIHKDKRSLHIGIIEGKIIFIDESILHFIEFINVKQTTEVYKYSYHYQVLNGNLIFRYDMAPHPEIETFPHHKHVQPNKLKAVLPPSLASILDEISDLIS